MTCYFVEKVIKCAILWKKYYDGLSYGRRIYYDILLYRRSINYM